MKRVTTILVMVIVGLSLVGVGRAENQQRSPSPDSAKRENPSDSALRSEIHRTMGALFEAQTAEEPDQAQIGKLTKELQQLRGKLRGPAATATENPAPLGPGAGRGAGFGRGWGAGGNEAGRGRGMGQGPRAGMGRGAGNGLGGGPGAGYGRRAGCCRCQGQGAGAFVDADKNGICDYYELRNELP